MKVIKVFNKIHKNQINHIKVMMNKMIIVQLNKNNKQINKYLNNLFN
jgi:hypothetical protein